MPEYIDYSDNIYIDNKPELSNTKEGRKLSNGLIENKYISNLHFCDYEGVVFRDCYFNSLVTTYSFVPRGEFVASFKNCAFERCVFDDCLLSNILVESCSFVDSLLYESTIRYSNFYNVRLDVTSGKRSFDLFPGSMFYIHKKSFWLVNACAIECSELANFWSENPGDLLGRIDIARYMANKYDDSLDKLFPNLTPDGPFVAYKYVKMKRRIERTNLYADSDTIKHFIDAGDKGFSEFDSTWGVPAITLGGRDIKHIGIAKLIVPEGARSSSAFGRKCRCDRLIVEGIYPFGSDTLITELDPLVDAVSPIYMSTDSNVKNYRPKAVLEEPSFDNNRWKECSHGFHFFMTKEEAEEYARDIANLNVAKNPKGGWEF